MLIDHTADLHLDNGLVRSEPVGWLERFDVEKYRHPNAEVLVSAGDTSNHPLDTADFLTAAAGSYVHVIAVNGNHELMSPTQAPVPANVHLLDEIPGQKVVIEGVAFVGGCLGPEDVEATTTVVAAVEKANGDPAVRTVVVISHYVPSARVGDIIGTDIAHKSNNLLDRLPTPAKPSVIVFGHLHVEIDAVIDGWRVVSNPRGYRGIRRDGTAWTGFGRLEI